MLTFESGGLNLSISTNEAKEMNNIQAARDALVQIRKAELLRAIKEGKK